VEKLESYNDFRDIDLGGDDPPAEEPPDQDNHTEAQKLVAYYLDEHTRLGRSRPTRTQTGIIAQGVGEKLEGGAKVENVRLAIRRLVERGRPPSHLPAFIGEVEAERTRAAPRNTFPDLGPDLTPEERAAALVAAAEGRKKLMALGAGVGRAMPT